MNISLANVNKRGVDVAIWEYSLWHGWTTSMKKRGINMKNVTLRQAHVLDFVARYQQEFHCSPTVREVAEAFGHSSSQGAYRHLEALTKKGMLLPIIAANGCRRGYRLSVEGERTLLLAGARAPAGKRVSALSQPAPLRV